MHTVWAVHVPNVGLTLRLRYAVLSCNTVCKKKKKLFTYIHSLLSSLASQIWDSPADPATRLSKQCLSACGRRCGRPGRGRPEGNLGFSIHASARRPLPLVTSTRKKVGRECSLCAGAGRLARVLDLRGPAIRLCLRDAAVSQVRASSSGVYAGFLLAYEIFCLKR